MKTSVAAILNFDGANEELKEVLRLAAERRAQWAQWAALPDQQRAAAAHEAQLRAELGEELFARRARLQEQGSGSALFLGPRALTLEPRRTAQRQQARAQAQGEAQTDDAGASTARRHVDPVLLDLGLAG